MLGLGGALTNASEPEQVLYSIVLDGDDYLDTGNTFQSTYRGSFSWSFWMKPDDGQPGSNEFLVGSDNADNTDSFYLALNTAGKINVRHEADNDPILFQSDAAVYANGAGAWKHICVTVTKATTSTYTIYVDGSADASDDFVGGDGDGILSAKHEDWTSTENTFIGDVNGAGGSPSGNPFTGKMSDVALFNVALEADAVLAIRNSGVPFALTSNKGNYDNASALVGYWRMDAGSGTFVGDSSGNGNHATFGGDPTFSTDTPDD